MLRPQASQVVTYAPDGTSPRWLGTLGHVSGLVYSYACPGGADQMSCVLAVPATYRTDALNPGRVVKVYRGAVAVWDGKLDEPSPSAAGWQITAHGSGTFGTDFCAVYDIWNNNPDESVNQAIARGLRWKNPGIGRPAGMWLGQRVDPGSQTVTDLLNLVCTKGGLTWYVDPQQGNTLSVFPLPAAPTRLLVSSTPVARTLGGDVNTIFIRFNTFVPLVFPGPAPGTGQNQYQTTSVTDEASVDLHGPLEAYMDLSSAGTILGHGLGAVPTMSQAEAQAVGELVLDRYRRASFAGPFTVDSASLTTLGGTPCDLGAQQAGMVCRLMLTDYGYGGEVVPGQISFLVGGYSYDDDAQLATVTPFQNLRTDFASLLGAVVTTFPAAKRQKL